MKAGILDLHREASRVLARLLPNLEQALTVSIKEDPQAWKTFVRHLEAHFDHPFNSIISFTAPAMTCSFTWKTC